MFKHLVATSRTKSPIKRVHDVYVTLTIQIYNALDILNNICYMFIIFHCVIKLNGLYICVVDFFYISVADIHTHTSNQSTHQPAKFCTIPRTLKSWWNLSGGTLLCAFVWWELVCVSFYLKCLFQKELFVICVSVYTNFCIYFQWLDKDLNISYDLRKNGFSFQFRIMTCSRDLIR